MLQELDYIGFCESFQQFYRNFIVYRTFLITLRTLKSQRTLSSNELFISFLSFSIMSCNKNI